MSEKESTFEYGFDFSNNNYDDVSSKDDEYEQLITAAIKKRIIDKQPKVIDEKQKNKLFKIRNCLYNVAKENNAKITIKNSSFTSTVCVEVESDALDFNTEKLKVWLLEAVKTSKFFSIESRTNEKFAIIAEVDVLKDIKIKAE